MSQEEDISKYLQQVTNAEGRTILVLDEFSEGDHEKWRQLLITENLGNKMIDSEIGDLTSKKLQTGGNKKVEVILFDENLKDSDSKSSDKTDIENICYFNTCDINLLTELIINTNIKFDLIIINFLYLEKIKNYFSYLYQMLKFGGKLIIQDIIEIRNYQPGSLDKYVGKTEDDSFKIWKKSKKFNFISAVDNFLKKYPIKKELRLGKDNPKLNISHIITEDYDHTKENMIKETERILKAYQDKTTENNINILKEVFQHSEIIASRVEKDKDLSGFPKHVEEKDLENFTFQYYIIKKNIDWNLDFIADSLPRLTKTLSGDFYDPQSLMEILIQKAKETENKMFIIDPFETLAIDMRTLWLEGKYPPPPDKDTLKKLSEIFFFYPGAETFLKYASGKNSWQNRIIFLAKSREDSEQLKKLLVTKNLFHVIVLNVFETGINIDIYQYIVEFFLVNPGLLDQLKKVYFVRYEDKKLKNNVLKESLGDKLVIYNSDITGSLEGTKEETTENSQKYRALLKKIPVK